MIALDTNVLVRVVTQDDPEQLRIALEVMQQPELFVTKTVMLETAWVLRFTYGLERESVHAALAAIVGYSNITVEDRTAVLHALAWLGRRLDFADALHLASGRKATAFATFDRRLAKAARAVADAPPVRFLGPPQP